MKKAARVIPRKGYPERFFDLLLMRGLNLQTYYCKLLKKEYNHCKW